MRPKLDTAVRLQEIPPYLFIELDRKKKAAVAAGRPVIDFGIGDPDLPTPAPIIAAMRKAVRNPACHRYPLGPGMPAFRKAVAEWYRSRFGVKLSWEDEVVALIGSKEGIAHFPWAFVNRGEKVLVPDPGYPVYRATTILLGGVPVTMPLVRENRFLPDLEKLSRDLRRGLKIRLMFINYPNNPTGACATPDFFKRVVALAGRYGFIVAHDAAYSEIYFDDKSRPSSFLETPGAGSVGIEFHSLSKTCNMTGWRVGFACGNAKLVSGLAKLKGNLDSGVFEAVQYAGIKGLEISERIVRKLTGIYRERRDILVDGLRTMGLPAPSPLASFYVWAPLPPCVKSRDFAEWMLREADVLVAPGVGFGRWGEGYVRVSLTVPVGKIREACRRFEKLEKA